MSKCWYCNEELTTVNYCDEHIGICTKCYNSMFKTGNEIIRQLINKITDLEAKLAESKKKIKGFVELFDKKQHENYEQFCEIQQLKQQLAESENTACKNIAELTKIATEKDRKIEELKQQLAEKEADLIALDTDNYSFKQQIDNLRQQLAEKDAERELDNSFWKQECDSLQKALEEKNTDLSLARNEIDTLKHNLNISQEHDNVICEQYFEKCKQHNQDKISFAVEKLEEVKHYAQHIQGGLINYIENQIKAIKGEK